MVVSAVVLATCNFLFIKRKPSVEANKLDSITATDDCSANVSSKGAEVMDVDEKGAREEQEKAINEEENKNSEKMVEYRPKSITVDSQEVERFLKDPQQNGSMAACPETCL